eukprot:CAMPEP_0173175772 /NCGR_PEP_ID=MMETSP1141-20130122/4093_1 /TAXON_ID=483371 /ORGANISM="non described non described, Strain CCMP2298" /LENGTH=398 /DNA_ID=CAMNT_0014098043 /DNA_START=88 /DNA_END=1281 /DNA_ORIENTATION=-
MEQRREQMRELIAVQTMLRGKDVDPTHRATLSVYLLELRSTLDKTNATLDRAEVEERREFLKQNKGLKDIFNTFWVVFMVHTTDGYLSKEGYTKFRHAIAIALIGQRTFEEVDTAAINTEYAYDKMLYGALNKAAFFDLLFETIETWTEIMDPGYYAYFSWALLDAIADTSQEPPHLRPSREISCITQVTNESVLIKSYVEKRKVRAALCIRNEAMQRVPAVQKRLHDRKKATTFDDASLTMLEAIALHASNAMNFSDSDEEETQQEDTVVPLLQAREGADLLEEDDEVYEEEGGLEAVAVSPQPAAIEPNQESGTRQSHGMTSSFLSYVSARKSTMREMNGSFGSGKGSGKTSGSGKMSGSGKLLGLDEGSLSSDDPIMSPSAMLSLVLDEEEEEDE